MATSNTDEPIAQQVLYTQASHAQHAQALHTIVDRFGALFPQVSELHWWQAYHHCQLDVYIVTDTMAIEPHPVTQLIAWVTLLHGPAVDETDWYAPASIYLADQINSFTSAFERVLATYQGKTTPQAAAAYLALLHRLLPQDLIARHLQTIGSFPEPEWQQTATPHPASSSLQDVLAWLPERTEELVALQWQSLREWISKEQNSLQSWNIARFSEYLGWPSLLVQQLFYGPQEPAQHPEIFTLERLTRLQVLLLHHRLPFP
ncbi:hypothetical protein J0X19_22315 [Hymenobacter sp. BT186]|uniref:Uncharacterized protein n=1 Tax=Hymenobacter telluris TaxID=2816474 RepID=A0A939F1N5_9BACT|nr:hypothetical protein [Hymenobacter telluris]MBO0360712.1 hypothetical protein [Hymenobacter telluris]MBW3376739.1 hypothetical protein [Hymenobacter norwichensis]